MNKNQSDQYHLTENPADNGTVTRKMVRERAVALAVATGRAASEVSKSDWDQAKRELMGKVTPGPEDTAPESAAESEGWGSAPASTGRHIPIPSGDDEDAEGRSDTERLVVEGVREAGEEQRRAANRPT